MFFDNLMLRVKLTSIHVLDFMVPLCELLVELPCILHLHLMPGSVDIATDLLFDAELLKLAEQLNFVFIGILLLSEKIIERGPIPLLLIHVAFDLFN